MALKPTRITASIPAELNKLIAQRVKEERYHSVSAYIVGLIMYDIYSRRPHWLTGSLMKEPQWVRDQVVTELVRDFGTKEHGPGWFERRLAELIEERHGKNAACSGCQHEARPD